MTHRFEIVPAKLYHVGQVVHRLRADHLSAFDALGISPHRALRNAFELSSFARSWLIDGRVAAIGGVTGSLLSSSGVIWLALTQEATRFSLEMVREGRRQLREIMSTYSEVESAILTGDEAAWRFAAFMGFALKRPATGSAPDVSLVELRARSLERILREAPEFRIPLPAGGSGVLIGYSSGALHG